MEKSFDIKEIRKFLFSQEESILRTHSPWFLSASFFFSYLHLEYLFNSFLTGQILRGGVTASHWNEDLQILLGSWPDMCVRCTGCGPFYRDSSFLPWTGGLGVRGGAERLAQALETHAAWVLLHSLSLPSWEMGKRPLLHRLVRI